MNHHRITKLDAQDAGPIIFRPVERVGRADFGVIANIAIHTLVFTDFIKNFAASRITLPGGYIAQGAIFHTLPAAGAFILVDTHGNTPLYCQ